MPQSREQREIACKRKFDLLMRTKCYTTTAAFLGARKNSWEQIAGMLAEDIGVIRATIDVYLSDDDVRHDKMLDLITVEDLNDA